jgi:hypothetical protein
MYVTLLIFRLSIALTGQSELQRCPAVQHACQGQTLSADGVLSGTLNGFELRALLTWYLAVLSVIFPL